MLFGALGVLAILISCGLGWLAPVAFHIPTELLPEAQTVLVLGGFTIASTLLGAVFGGVVTGLERFDISAGVEILLTTVRSAAVLAALKLGYGLVALALMVIAPRLPIDGEETGSGGGSSLGLGPGALVALLAGLQAALGGLNVVLLAPVWLQLVHLLVADLLWMSVVLLAATVLAGRAPAAYLVSAVGPYIAGTGTSSIRR